eukprot:124501_1
MATATSSLRIIHLLSLSILLNVAWCHLKCGHDSFDHVIQRNIHTSRPKQTSLNHDNRNKRNLQEASNHNLPASNEWDNIRIAYNTEGLLAGWSDDTFKHWFATDVIPAAIDYLEKVIQVRPIDGNLTLERRCNTWANQEENKCHHISSSYKSCGGYHDIEDRYFDEIYSCDESDCTLIPSGGGTAHDLTLYFVGKSSSYGCNGVYGFSSFCHSNLYDRPIAGFVNLCEKTLLDEGQYFTWEKAVTLVVHEVYHVLGFSSTGFAYFRKNDAARTARSPRAGGDDGNGDLHNNNFGFPQHGSESGLRWNYGKDTIISTTIRGKNAAFIVLPTVVDVIRKFYNCSTMIGLELEDFGGVDTASSHWEQRILSMEFMIGYISSAAPVSVFSFAVFEDSGWYKMNWDYATVPPYGKGFGCDWYEEKCVIEDAAHGEYEALDDDLYCTSDVKYACAADYVGKSNCELTEYEDGELPSAFQYFGGFGHGDGDQANIGGVLGYADFCPMFYHYSNGDCRITESSHAYESFGAEICPNCKCNEMYSSDFTKNYAICYPTECAQNYLYEDQVGEDEYDPTNAAFYKDYSDYVATRVKVSNEGHTKHEYITCWRFESSEYKDTSYYSYSIKCPEFEDICYDRNPWICNGHGMRNRESTSVYDECFCNHGYIGCDCTVRNTQINQADTTLIEDTCVADTDNDYAGSMPFDDEDDMEWSYLGLVNVTVQLD